MRVVIDIFAIIGVLFVAGAVIATVCEIRRDRAIERLAAAARAASRSSSANLELYQVPPQVDTAAAPFRKSHLRSA